MSPPTLRHQRILRLMCCLAYFAKYISRSNYAAVILAICEMPVLPSPGAFSPMPWDS